MLELITHTYQHLHLTFFTPPHTQTKPPIIPPLYFKPHPDHFQLTLFQLQYPNKFLTIQHQHLLPTLISLPIQTHQLRHIIVRQHIHFLFTKQLQSYIISQLTPINPPSLKLNSIPTQH
ncbi:YlmH/Sll1252 family protein, partial [Staphylococcus epidermidis]|uniref:YlmH/Sll1252 family protein n=1 Tax=Staphylococcus epidermidis TaxID=1282 RepID=UPI0037D9C740